ncbi:MAG: family transporter [Herminiimonas sp.]|nr:family transporter [Herminiimonas sp.]
MDTKAAVRPPIYAKVLVASLVGSVIEWFDYFLYGTVAVLVFNKLFFPSFDPVVGLMLSYLSFSLTFFVRPFGGILYSHIATLVTVGAIPIMGMLADKIGNKKVFIIGSILMALFAYPYFMLLDIGKTWGIILASVLVLGLVWAPIVATIGSVLAQIFSTRVRFTGITIGSQLGAAFAGGTAPLIATWLLKENASSWSSVAIYIIVCAVVSLVSVASVARKKEEAHNALGIGAKNLIILSARRRPEWRRSGKTEVISRNRVCFRGVKGRYILL